uniref:Protein kinase domain-containing protein n=1 Tax=Acrobeloides nanus TaxID=290746 RepID=A0A914DPX1_9BILA
MRVLFLIPKNAPPQLNGSQWSKSFKEFVDLCLNKNPDDRPPARELLKHPFIRRAKKNNILIELIERTADYKSRLGPSSDSDADDDGESQAGNDGWEYPTIRNTLDNNGVNHGRKPSVDDDGTDTVRVTKNNRPSIKQQNDDISPNDTIVNHGANQTVAAIANQLKQSSIRENNGHAHDNERANNFYSNSSVSPNSSPRQGHKNGAPTTIALRSPTNSPPQPKRTSSKTASSTHKNGSGGQRSSSAHHHAQHRSAETTVPSSSNYASAHQHSTNLYANGPLSGSPKGSFHTHSSYQPPPVPQHMSNSFSPGNSLQREGRTPNAPRGSLECALLPALDKLSRTRHGGAADLALIAKAFKQAETESPGLCDHLVTELLTTLAYPQAQNHELRVAIDRLTTKR